MKKITFLAASLIILAACTPKTTEIIEIKEVETVEEKSEFPTTDIAQGNQLYLENCGKCHKFKTITNYNEEQWSKIVPNMCAKAKLDASAESQILNYVLWEIKK